MVATEVATSRDLCARLWGYFLGVPEFRPGWSFGFGIFRGNSGSGHLGVL